MSDPMQRLESMLSTELRRPVATNPAAKARLMDLVRVAPQHRGAGRLSRRSLRNGWALGGWVSSVAGMAIAAGITSVVVVDGANPNAMSEGRGRESAAVAALSDSVASVLNSSFASSLRDTLRLVTFALVAPGATSVALAGDFNAWNPRATPLVSSGKRGRWSAAVAMGPGVHRYAFVVNDTQWVADPAAPRSADSAGRPRSVLSVQHATF